MENIKIAMFAPYFAPRGSGFPNYYEYWLKSVAANSKVDFFIPTNVDVSKYTEYGNIHYIIMSAEDFWKKVENTVGFPVYHGYYKTAEYRPLFGIIFSDVLQGYDYWGQTEFDCIYGDILKYVMPYINEGKDVIGRYGTFRLIKNIDRLNYIPFFKLQGFKHPLTLEVVYSQKYIWYFDEIEGMGAKYFQAGVEVTPLDENIADIKAKQKCFTTIYGSGKWGFVWKNGKLIGINEKGETQEFLYAHFQKRKLECEPCESDIAFTIVPNRISNGEQMIGDISSDSLFYIIRYYYLTFNRMIDARKGAETDILPILRELRQYCYEHKLDPLIPKSTFLYKVYYKVKEWLFWQ